MVNKHFTDKPRLRL